MIARGEGIRVKIFVGEGPMIREATAADLDQIVSIYNEAVAAGFETAHTEPQTARSRSAWFWEHEPDRHPVYVREEGGRIDGWCSLGPYRPGRQAFRFTAEISVYIRGAARRKGIATGLMRHAIDRAPSLGIRTLVAMILEPNAASRAMVAKLGFSEWGFLPGVADFDGTECGHVFYGKRIGGSGPAG
jgi:phosphinothricin acetyltransferase